MKNRINIKTPFVRTCIHVNIELKQRLQMQAILDKTSMSFLLNQAAEEYLNRSGKA